MVDRSEGASLLVILSAAAASFKPGFAHTWYDGIIYAPWYVSMNPESLIAAECDWSERRFNGRCWRGKRI
jgi:hypothetical protein